MTKLGTLAERFLSGGTPSTKDALLWQGDIPWITSKWLNDKLYLTSGEKRSHNYFLTHLMNHWREEGVFVRLARRAVNQANYNRNEISVLKIPLPSYEEQREIANSIGTVDSKLSLCRSKQTVLTDLFRTLLHQLMTAQIRVHDLDLSFLEQEAKAG